MNIPQIIRNECCNHYATGTYDSRDYCCMLDTSCRMLTPPVENCAWFNDCVLPGYHEPVDESSPKRAKRRFRLTHDLPQDAL
jgi:hypothetical protein